jgi:hypothetical protein
LFPRQSDKLKLLKVNEKQLGDRMITDKNLLRGHGVRHLKLL